jgi:hypothetical protein
VSSGRPEPARPPSSRTGRVAEALAGFADRAAALGFGRVSRGDLLKRPRPVDEAKRQKILEKREKLMERIRCLARLVGLSHDPDPLMRVRRRTQWGGLGSGIYPQGHSWNVAGVAC